MKKQTTYKKYLGIFTISFITYISMSFSTPSDAFANPVGTCALSVQLQDSQTRTQYTNRLAIAVGNQPTSVEAMYQNTEPATFSENDGFTLFSFGAPPEETFNSTSLDGIDQFSTECLSCHDGVTASLVQPKVKEFPSASKTFGGRSTKDHSIGMRYELYSATGTYKPAMNSSSSMVFVDGKVGCLTCHNPLNPEKNHLVMSDARSALCMTCHIR